MTKKKTIENFRIDKEKTILVGVHIKRRPKEEALQSIEELSALADTAKLDVIEKFIVPRNATDPSQYIGKGKIEEIKEYCSANKIEVVVVDDPLTPIQSKKLNALLKVKVLDRIELILDIFAYRAQTKEAQIQVELAQLKYLLPRLTRMWLHLSRQEGGIGLRGPGETQIEIDRRRIREKIHRCQENLKEIRRQRQLQRKERKRKDYFRISLVGYTNAGKSSLFTSLTECSTLIEDKLFCTLDPLTRKVEIKEHFTAIITDTVGFVRKLPHFLVEAFKSTLEEVFEADYLLHLIDGSGEGVENRISTVLTVFKEMGIEDPEQIVVFNKIDLMTLEKIDCLKEKYPNSCFISVKDNLGINELKNEIIRLYESSTLTRSYLIPHSDIGKIQVLFDKGCISHQEYLGEGLQVTAKVDQKLEQLFKSYEVNSI